MKLYDFTALFDANKNHEHEMEIIENQLTKLGGTIGVKDVDGRKRLAYDIVSNGRKHEFANYTHYTILVEDDKFAPLFSSWLNVHDPVIRYMLVLKDANYEKDKGKRLYDKLEDSLEKDYKAIKEEQLALDYEYKYYKIALCYELKEYLEEKDYDTDQDIELLEVLAKAERPLETAYQYWQDRESHLWEDFGYMFDDIRRWEND